MMPIPALIAALATGFIQPAIVPFRITDEAIIVDAAVNERPVSLMFDSGFSGAVVLNEAIDVGPTNGSMTIRDFVGEMEVKTAKLRTLKIGSEMVDSTGMEIVQQPLARMSVGYNTHTDGILGLGALQGYVTEINFQKHAFVLHPKTFDITKRLVDGKRIFLTKLLPIGNTALDMEVTVSTGKSLTMVLDTGNAFYATTHKDVLERVGLWPVGKKPEFTRASQVASGTVESWSAMLKNTTIFGVPVASSIWDVIDLPSSAAESDGTVGYQFLKNFNVTFDYERRRVLLERISDEVSNDAVGETGIFAAYSPARHRIEIFSVAPSSPAERAGIKEDDELLSIGDLDLTNQHYRQLRKLLEGPVGSRVTIAVSHLGELKRCTLDRVSLVNQT